MYGKKSIFIYLFILTFSVGSLFAQPASATADVSLSVKKGLSIANDGGNLDFDDVIIVGDAGSVNRDPEFGVRFKVTGNNTGNVTISFGNATLLSGVDPLTFVPAVESTAGSQSYASAASVSTGDSPAMTDKGGGTGELYLWVGGSIDYTSAPQGDYVGTFTMSVAY